MIACPSCGSTNLEASEETRSISAPFGPAIPFIENVEKCMECEESGDFSNVNDPRIEHAWTESQKASIPVMFELLEKGGLTLPYIERVLHLDFGTLNKFRDEGSCSSPAEYALLRIIASLPAIIHTLDQE